MALPYETTIRRGGPTWPPMHGFAHKWVIQLNFQRSICHGGGEGKMPSQSCKGYVAMIPITLCRVTYIASAVHTYEEMS